MSDVRGELRGKSVVVLGIARSGRMALQLLQWLGAHVTVFDKKPLSEMEEIASELDQQEIKYSFGVNDSSMLESADLIVVSPGVPIAWTILDAARRAGVPIIAEIELAFPYLKGRLVGVTGTNGKSTTVTMVGKMLEQAGIPVRLGGNLGTPLSTIALDCLRGDVLTPEYIIAELSSFQLEAIHVFRPWLAVILNVTDDHMDRYDSFDDYVLAKSKILKCQKKGDYGLINDDDSVVRTMSSVATSSLMKFSAERAVDFGVYLDGSRVVSKIGEDELLVCHIEELYLQGKHNLQNAMAATAIALLCGCSVEVVRDVLKSFSGLEHACEHVRDYHGVTFINDSKATNVAATVRALESCRQPIVLIAGGRDKVADFSKLVSAIRLYVKVVILIGESRQKIHAALVAEAFPKLPMYFAESINVAIDLAYRESNVGDAVVFSPACASFDMFEDYQHRGREFKELVCALP